MESNQSNDLPLLRYPYPHRELVRRYREHFKDRDYRMAAIASFAALCGSIIASLMAGHFANVHASNYVEDIILSNTPALNLDTLFVFGTMLFTVFVGIVAFAHPRRIPFMFYSLALFFFIRAGFVTLTHIAPFPLRSDFDFGVTIRHYFFGSDLFFSGHTGSPFLMALLFWHEWRLRIMFLAWSVFFAFVVLLGHLHYSIDVASAFFITYTIYHIAQTLFPEYYALFYSDLPEDEA